METYKTESEEDQYLLELAIFMASSTRDVINFKHYGTIRLLRSLVKVLDLPNHVKHVKKDKFLDEIRMELEMNRSLTKDKEVFANFLDDLIVKMLKEYRSRLTQKQRI